MTSQVPAEWLNFASDNVWGAAPEITAALAGADMSPAASYGDDACTQAVLEDFRQLFDYRQLEMFPVVTGTAANVVAMASVTPPYGVIYTTDLAHMVMDECGALEFYTHGARLHGFAQQDGKLDPVALERYLATLSGRGVVHRMQPAAISITQATECGTVYTVAEIRAISDVARKYGLMLHMDGARFANAMAYLGTSAADMTWRAGVDVLSFGATKNGAWAAEAIVVFNPDAVRDLEYRRKRGGHLLSKSRFITLQLQAYLAQENWMRYARHANLMAQRLAEGMASLGVSPVYAVEANEVFMALNPDLTAALRAKGYIFYDWPYAQESVVRLVTAYATPPAAIDAFLSMCASYAP